MLLKPSIPINLDSVVKGTQKWHNFKLHSPSPGANFPADVLKFYENKFTFCYN